MVLYRNFPRENIIAFSRKRSRTQAMHYKSRKKKKISSIYFDRVAQ